MNIRRKFSELSLNVITPKGWLRRYLELQRHGLTGHMEAAGYPFDTDGWADPAIVARSGTAWWPYEQTAYWVDGAIRCAHLLCDQELIAKAGQQIAHVLKHADGDGYLGPAFLKNGEHWCRWPHAVFLRALMAEYSATGNTAIPQAVARHFLGSGRCHSNHRDVCNIEAMLWAAEHTGDERLIELAERSYREYNRLFPEHDTAVSNMLSDKVAGEHGVTYNEIGKLGAILYAFTGRKRYLDATVSAYRKVDRDHMLVDGIHSSAEHLGGRDPLASHETCDIADYTWSVGYLLMITGRAEYADKLERACFNAAPGAVRTHDFGGLQYFSCPNQFIADNASNHNLFFRGAKWMSFRPNPGTECCPGEVNRIMPNYIARMWLRDGNGGLTAALYGPGSVTVPTGPEGRTVTVLQETDYPFGERIDFHFRCDFPVAFPFTLRIPGWCNDAELMLNGKPLGHKLSAGTFITVTREFMPNDRLSLLLPMKLRLTRWPEGGVAIERGPLVFALRIEENWQVDHDEPRSTSQLPAWNLTAGSPWNYALDVDENCLTEEIEVVHRDMSSEPWTLDHAPIILRVPARRVKGWRLNEKNKIVRTVCNKLGTFERQEIKGHFVMTPPLPDQAVLPKRLGKRREMVTLVPYGCTHLRLTVFPDAQSACLRLV
jgi:DUF1680 family protein